MFSELSLWCCSPHQRHGNITFSDHLQVCHSPKCAMFVGGKKNCHILCSHMVVHIKHKVTALPFQNTLWTAGFGNVCVWIKAKLFTMDDITDNDTVMG